MPDFCVVPVSSEHEYWLLRRWLRSSYRKKPLPTPCWHIQRLDYTRYHIFRNCYERDLLSGLFLLKDADDNLVGAIIPDCPEGVCLQWKPSLRQTALDTLLTFAVENLGQKQEDGRRLLHTPAPVTDSAFESLLVRYGFSSTEWCEYRHHKVIGHDDCGEEDIGGFTIRSMGDASEYPARSWASWRAFHPDDPDSAYEGWEWYRKIQESPMYRRDFDLVAVSGEGMIVAFCTFWVDDDNRSGYIDPLGVVPEYQRKGLGRALIGEGCRRLATIGITDVFVESYDDIPRSCYEACGMKVESVLRSWRRCI